MNSQKPEMESRAHDDVSNAKFEDSSSSVPSSPQYSQNNLEPIPVPTRASIIHPRCTNMNHSEGDINDVGGFPYRPTKVESRASFQHRERMSIENDTSFRSFLSVEKKDYDILDSHHDYDTNKIFPHETEIFVDHSNRKQFMSYNNQHGCSNPFTRPSKFTPNNIPVSKRVNSKPSLSCVGNADSKLPANQNDMGGRPLRSYAVAPSMNNDINKHNFLPPKSCKTLPVKKDKSKVKRKLVFQLVPQEEILKARSKGDKIKVVICAKCKNHFQVRQKARILFCEGCKHMTPLGGSWKDLMSSISDPHYSSQKRQEMSS